MKNLFSSPRATRLLAAAIGFSAFALFFVVYFMLPDGGPNAPRLIDRLVVVFLFGSGLLWIGARYWKDWLVEYRYGLRLALTDRDVEAINGTTTINELQFLASTPVPSNLIDRSVTKEKLRFPWPSLICTALLIALE